MRIKLDDLEDNPTKYIGKTISVDGEVEDVFGPRVFTIDEPNWGDLEGETLVFLPTTLAALVRENDRVTITGTMKPFVRAEVEREWGWLGIDGEIELDVAKKPVLVASRIVGGNNNTALVIALDESDSTPVGTSGSTTGSPLTDAATLADGGDDLVGRRVNLTGLKVHATAKDGGFFAKTANGTVFVLPAEKQQAAREGDTVSVKGVVLQLPRHMQDSLKGRAGGGEFNDDIYVYATSLNK